MAHKKGLDGVYLEPTMEECFAEFEKAIPELTVDGEARKQILLEQKEKTIDKMSKEYQELIALKKTDDERWNTFMNFFMNQQHPDPKN